MAPVLYLVWSHERIDAIHTAIKSQCKFMPLNDVRNNRVRVFYRTDFIRYIILDELEIR